MLEILEEIEKEQNSYEAQHIKSYAKGLEKAAEIIQKHMNDGWISCDERLPEEGIEVLVTVDTGYITFGYIEDGEWRTDLEPDYPLTWRPLPDPYKPPVGSADSKRMMEREEFFKDGEL